jgi:hypothetical protein
VVDLVQKLSSEAKKEEDDVRKAYPEMEQGDEPARSSDDEPATGGPPPIAPPAEVRRLQIEHM